MLNPMKDACAGLPLSAGKGRGAGKRSVWVGPTHILFSLVCDSEIQDTRPDGFVV